jgi:hypothetical protein
VIVLRRWREPVERVVIDPGGIRLGPEGEPPLRYLFPSRNRLQDLSWFVRNYARFRVARDGGELAFGGRGPAAPNATEQRMIVEWARAAVAEVMVPHSGEAYGLALAWHRGGSVGDCEDVAVYLSGEVRASSCSWDHEVRGRLSPDQLGRIYSWVDALAPFQDGGTETGATGEGTRLVFAGQGRKEPKQEQLAEMRGVAQALHREMSPPEPAPGKAVSPQAPLASPAQPAAGKGEKAAGKPGQAGKAEEAAGGPRLLVIPEAAGGRAPAAIPPKLEPPARPVAGSHPPPPHPSPARPPS